MHSHRDFAFNTEVYAKRTVGYRADDVTVSVPRLFFGYATGTNLWFPFAVGATRRPVQRAPDRRVASPRAIARYRPTVVTNVPTMLGKLLDLDDERRARGEPGLDLSSVRFHLSAGEALPEPLLRRFVERFRRPTVYDGIGSAEMFHIYCSNRPGDVKPGSLGRVVEGYELAILPEDADGPGGAAAAARRDRRAVGARRLGRARLLPAIATRAGRRSTATGAAPAICSRSTRAATCGSPAAPTTCSRSAACSSRRARSRTACSRTRRCRSPR